MHPLWPELLKHLFTTRSEDLRPWLFALSLADQQALWKQHKPDLAALRKACQFSASAGVFREEKGEGLGFGRFLPRYPTLAPFRADLPSDNVAAWITAERVNICLAEDLYPFYLNLETVWAALGDAKSVALLAKFKDQAPQPRWEILWTEKGDARADAPEGVLYSLTQTLGLRGETWGPEFLMQAFANHAELYGHGQFYRAVICATQTWPEQDWVPYLAKALALEIVHYKDRLADIPLTYLFAALAWEAPSTPAFRSMGPAVITYTEVVTYLSVQAQSDLKVRQTLLELTLERLQHHTRPAQNQPWIKLWNQLTPSLSELGGQFEALLMLVNASAPNALQLALQELKRLAAEAIVQPHIKELLSLLALNLVHPTQKIAKDSLALMRLIDKHHPSQDSLLPILIPYLLTPHMAVRQEILKGFKGQTLPPSAQDILRDLLASGQLNPLEQENLAVWVVDPPVAVLTVSQDAPEPTPAFDIAQFPSHRQSWAKQLIQALEGGVLEPLLPTLDVWQTLPDLQPLPNAEELQHFFVSHARGQVSELDFEIALISVLQVPAPTDRARAEKYLDPLLKIVSKMDRPEATQNWNIPWHNGLLALLAQGWLEPGKQITIQTPEIDAFLQQPFLKPLFDQVTRTLALLAVGASARLSQPDNVGGWIFPERLLQRLVQLPPEAITASEVEDALYALAPVVISASAWADLFPHLSRYTPLVQQALTVALAPETEAEATAAQWIKTLQQDPPQQFLLQAEHGGASAPETSADQGLQLLCAALAHRQLLPYWHPWPCLQTLPIEQLQCDLGMDYGALHMAMFAQTAALQELDENASDEAFLEALMAFVPQPSEVKPEPPARRIKPLAELSPELKALCQQCLIAASGLESPPPDSIIRALEHARFQVMTPHYRRLMPLLLWVQPKTWIAIDTSRMGLDGLIPLLWPCPGNAQRLFEVGVVQVARMQGRFGGMTRQQVNQLWQAYYQAGGTGEPPQISWHEMIPNLDKQDINLSLLSMGLLPWVPLQSALDVLLEVLTSKHSQHRERIIAVLDTGLRDGRLTPDRVAKGLAELLLTVSKGFSYVQDALTGWSNRDPLGELLVLLALEQFFARLHPGINGKVLSALLDQAHGLCRTLGRGISAPEARTALTTLAEAKKKTVARDKAKLLLALPQVSVPLMQSVIHRLVAAVALVY